MTLTSIFKRYPTIPNQSNPIRIDTIGAWFTYVGRMSPDFLETVRAETGLFVVMVFTDELSTPVTAVYDLVLHTELAQTGNTHG